jgi:hypothetical protein
VYVAFSNGAGFGPVTFALADFGFAAGSWKVPLHPRMLGDINGDGRKDIIGFGDAGVYTARSNGVGFDAAQFVIADLGVNQGWSTSRHVRLVADINGDTYADIVAMGEKELYRALGGPNGLTQSVTVLRDFTPPRGYSSPVSNLRLVGDVNGDGLQDILGIQSAAVNVALSSNAAPQPPPNAPTSPRVSNITSSSLSLSWQDNSNNEREFDVVFGKRNGSQSTAVAGSNATTRAFTSLDADSDYCFEVHAENVFGLSSGVTVCGRTLTSGGGGGGGGGGGSTQVCGTSIAGCPTGTHPNFFRFSTTCPGTGTSPNATQCDPNISVYTACGVRNCAAGWHATGFIYQGQCDLQTSTGDHPPNSSQCATNTNSFFACASCPPGYTQDATASVPQCGGFPQVHCVK